MRPHLQSLLSLACILCACGPTDPVNADTDAGEPGPTDTTADGPLPGSDSTAADETTSSPTGPSLACAPARPFPYPDGAYVSNHAGPGNADRVRCEGIERFEVRWQALEGHTVGQPNTFSPDGARTYVASTQGPDGCSLHALAVETGEVVWSRCGLGNDLVATTVDVDEDGVLYLTAGNLLYALDPEDGSTLWQQPLDDALGGLVYGVKLTETGRVATQVSDGTIYMLDRSSGDVVASLDVAAQTGFVPGETRTVQTALIPGFVWDRVYLLLGTDDEDQVLEAINGLLGGSGAFADNTLAVAGNHMFSVGGGPTPDRGAVVALTFDEADHLELAWTSELAAGSASSVALSSDGSRAYVADGEGTIVALDVEACDANEDDDPTPGGCAPAWTYAQPGVVAGSMTISDEGRLFALSIGEVRDRAIYALDDRGDAPDVVFARSYGENEIFTTALTLADNALYGVLTDIVPFTYLDGVDVPLTRSSVSSRAVAIDPDSGDILFSTAVPNSSVTELLLDPHGGLMLTMAGLAETLVLDRDAPDPVGGIVRLVAPD